MSALVADDKLKAIEQTLIGGDLAKLSSAELVNYYNEVCKSLGLNSLTRPFEYITLNGKLTLYARRDSTDQLRKIHKISVQIVAREKTADFYCVTAQATDVSGRMDESMGAVSIANLKGEQLANALMKAETKAKRRVTLSICGLGFLDETEIDSIRIAQAQGVSKAKQIQALLHKDQERSQDEFIDVPAETPKKDIPPGERTINVGSLKGKKYDNVSLNQLEQMLLKAKSLPNASDENIQDFINDTERYFAHINQVKF